MFAKDKILQPSLCTPLQFFFNSITSITGLLANDFFQLTSKTRLVYTKRFSLIHCLGSLRLIAENFTSG